MMSNDYLWEKTKKIYGKDSNLYRKDIYGNIMYKPSHGKNSPMGWKIDYIELTPNYDSNLINGFYAVNMNVNVNKENAKILLKKLSYKI
ncbi:MAG: HNH endonuclease [Methanosarcinales archaeon]|nr:HNH endonuclease [Methanosarcinales archaeon]